MRKEPDLLEIIENQKNEIDKLKQDVSDLNIALETAIDHGDSIEDQLLVSNDALLEEAKERKKAEQNLRHLIKALTQQKDDLEVLVETITEHGDDVQYEWLQRLGTAEEEALTDALTSVANRRHFDQYLLNEWKRAMRHTSDFSIAMIDIDYFKRYNDKYGHQSGDECIQKIAKEGQRICARSTDLFARYGGEEFAMVLPDTNYDGAINLANKFIKAVEELYLPHEESIVSGYVSVSIGVASCCVTSGCEFDGLLQLADNMLYKAKETGRNRVAGKNNCK